MGKRLSKEKKQKIIESVEKGISMNQTARDLKVSPSTVSTYVKSKKITKPTKTNSCTNCAELKEQVESLKETIEFLDIKLQAYRRVLSDMII